MDPYRDDAREVFPRKLESVNGDSIYRLRVFGGWVVKYSGYSCGGICFVPDPEHRWILEEKK